MCLTVMKLLSGETMEVRTCSPVNQPDGCQMNPGDMMPANINCIDVEVCYCNEDLCNSKLSIIKLFINLQLSIIMINLQHISTSYDFCFLLKFFHWVAVIITSIRSTVRTRPHFLTSPFPSLCSRSFFFSPILFPLFSSLPPCRPFIFLHTSHDVCPRAVGTQWGLCRAFTAEF